MRTEAPTPTAVEIAESVFRAFALRDVDAVVSHAHPDCVDDFVAVGVFPGQEAIRPYYEEIFRAFPDFVIEPLHIVGDDRRAAVQWVAHGTFSGAAFQGVQPTGARMELRGVDFMEIEDGLIRHNTIYYDGASFARQVGLLPPEGSLTERGLLAAANTRTRLKSLLRRRRGR